MLLPDTVLLNGGCVHPTPIATATDGFAQPLAWQCHACVHNPHPDWAVARGAAAYGLARHQAEQIAGQLAEQQLAKSQSNQPLAKAEKAQAAIKTILPRIGGGSARSYWLLLPGKKGQAPQGICLLPRGTEEGVRIVLSGRRFALKLGQAVRFNLLANSQSHLPVQAGQIAPLTGDGWVELRRVTTVLPAQRQGHRQEGRLRSKCSCRHA